MLCSRCTAPLLMASRALHACIASCRAWQGLEDQLLAEVVRQERPELEEQRDRLVTSIAADKRQLQDLEVRDAAAGRVALRWCWYWRWC